MFLLNLNLNGVIYDSFNRFFHYSINVNRPLNYLLYSLFYDSFHGIDDNVFNWVVNEPFNNYFPYNSVLNRLLNDYFIRFFHNDFFDHWSFNYYFIRLFNYVLLDNRIFRLHINMALIALCWLHDRTSHEILLNNLLRLRWFILQSYVFGQGFHNCIGVTSSIS